MRLYLDADMSINHKAGASIEMGIRTALDKLGWKLGGYPVSLEVLDNRGNSLRSREHLHQFLEDKAALAVFCGLHSPPVLENQNLINEHHILMLNPWAAAGPITRPESTENWIFRLSIDDSKAGEIIIDHLHRVHGLKKPVLLLEATGWGASNEKTMRQALKKRNLRATGVFRFPWGTTPYTATEILQEAMAGDPDSIVLVANTPEGKSFAKAMSDIRPESRLPVFSHWGITGGNFFEALSPDIQWEFIQTGFPFVTRNGDLIVKETGLLSKKLFSDLETMADLGAPAGFVHGFDITLILGAAADQAGLTGDIQADRLAVHQALENLAKPVPGLLKTYNRPFSAYNRQTPDAHEALGPEDYKMGRFNSRGHIVPFKW
ncbi:branched-chain amino acid transport system substrate-binding protein [Desulfosalsimonas propionicica]|uniref:Branched-chain amino acid transport system substrate-binding protein n=1 Tax=Desulfosalsimonas propionicica TaxID=332175 RepID=A0A7W0HKQ3_9BACT|nr:ABC transporter substrate-binding protein [Desulfosalsimonas propionicica]MBA2881448.1 branched-chain amino acid transport system substrate-binding protein [Desulfosalsimonas propionicica]